MIYKIVSDSSSDVTEIEDIPFSSVPLKIHTKEREFTDTPDFETNEMISYLAGYKGRSGSSCPNVQEWTEAFGDADNVFCVALTKNLSGSYSSACAAAAEYKSLNKEKNVHVFDTLSVGPETHLLIEKLREEILRTRTFADIVASCEEYIKKTRLFFSLKSLQTLANNGRANPLVAKMASALGIHAIGRASDEGTLELTDKVRGEINSQKRIFDNMKSEGYLGGRVRIHHCQAKEQALSLFQRIKEAFPRSDVKISETRALCSFYAERGGLLIGFEV